MTDFLSDSFCRGLRPRHLPQFAVESRRFLVARLMKAHHQPCFLVAPAGFGKSLLADQFASLMFSYWRTFWLDCQDLRFIRLLDEDALVEGIFQRDEHPALVVFDDLPTLSQQQAQKFCRCILSLQEAGCRVLACMTPVCFDEEYDCVNPLVITGKSMLVQSSERLEAASSQLFPEPFCRIPLLAREGEQGVAPLLRGLAFDEFTFQELLVALCLCALGRGSLALLERIFSPADLSLCLRTLEEYPLFAFDHEAQTFRAVPCSTTELETVLLPLMAETRTFTADLLPEDFNERVVDLLYAAGKSDAASLAAVALLPRAVRGAWTLRHAEALLLAGEYAPCLRLAESMVGCGDPFEALALLCRTLISGSLDQEAALCLMQDADGSPETRGLSAMLLLRCSSNMGYQKEAADALAVLLVEETLRSELLRQACAFALGLYTNFHRAFSLWEEACVQGNIPWLAVAALWLAEQQLADGSLPGRETVARYLAGYASQMATETPTLSAGARRVVTLFRPRLAPVRPTLEYHAIAIPRLRVRLWGTFRLVLGDRVLDERAFSRKKSMTLLALLAANVGQDLSREVAIEMLWPGVSLKSGRRRLYNIWGELRNVLALPDGSCPYLLGTKTHFRLNSACVDCDTQEVSGLCRMLQSEHVDIPKWTQALDELTSRFSGEYLPCDVRNERLDLFRRESSAQIVDSLVRAAEVLLEKQEPWLALRFAREALLRDQEREDAYAIVMRSQIATGQRASALGTFLSCRSYLQERLGMDPSTTMVRLYEAALECETAVEG